MEKSAPAKLGRTEDSQVLEPAEETHLLEWFVVVLDDMIWVKGEKLATILTW